MRLCAVLAATLAEEDDYEFRIIGGVHVQAYGVNQQGKRMSDVISEAPAFGQRLKTTADAVVKTRAPLAYRGAVGRDAGDARFLWLETVFLPLGNTVDAADHIVIATVYVPRNGIWPERASSP